MSKLSERIMAWLVRPLPQPKWVQLAPVVFLEKLMASKKALRIVKDNHFLVLWFKSGHCYGTTVEFGSWLVDLLERKFPAKMSSSLDYNDYSRWQKLNRKELKAIR